MTLTDDNDDDDAWLTTTDVKSFKLCTNEGIPVLRKRGGVGLS